ncbi:MAG TPA: NAD(P)-binding domain-containing protein [Kofleriaceae bacterium]|nr:NAD(P)-binding domain-containing protein [Kofleriaceae bacterium]
MASARKRHQAIVAPPQPGVSPRILVHDINDDRCTGCDACVAVCPTNVLDLVANKSRVLRFHDCIQCEACMFACPTEALVMFPQGSEPPPLKVPEIDDNFQTVVPGQYLIGEVAGKPLVKNAANLGRAVIEHMLATGMRPGAIGNSETIVDVLIVGSGPGGLSAALTCIQRGLSYVVLEKEQMIASTIARYPKGKLVMAEPYDTENLSLLPVFDSAKEQLIPIWQELLERVGVRVRQNESVETVGRAPDGAFEVRSTVAVYRAQRVVLSIGTRGKPRTLQVPGENLPKIYSLLEDPDEWRGRSVLVVGGGDSACEAALALADAGAKVMISYRGKGFSRAAPKNKQTIEQYAAEGRIKAKLGSQVLAFDAESVTLALADGSQKRYPNDAAFVLIGADPPIAWLEKMGIRFVERPHQYQMGKSDDIVRRYVQANECPEDAARAAAQILGGSTGFQPSKVAAAAAVSLPMPMGEPVSGPRKWLRSATSIFSNRPGTNSGVQPLPRPDPRSGGGGGGAGKAKRFDAPVPLSEFAKRKKTVGPGKDGTGIIHSGDGRRDALSAGERTRILRMLRDEGGRLADEDSQVYIGTAPNRDFDFDFDDSPAPAPVPNAPLPPRPDVPAKPAVVVGLAQAQSRSRAKKPSAAPAGPRVTGQARPPLPPPGASGRAQPPAPLHLRDSDVVDSIPAAPSRPPRTEAPRPAPRRPVPPPFSDEPTRQVDDQLLAALRGQGAASPGSPPLSPPPRAQFSDEPTKMANIDPRAYDETGQEEITGPGGGNLMTPPPIAPPRPPPPAQNLFSDVEDHGDEATRLASLDSLAAMERARNHGGNDERTRAVNIRNDPSISDVDWDLD